MKTFIVYDLDRRLPIAVGSAIKAEWARIETEDKARLRAENLIAEEITALIFPYSKVLASSWGESVE